MGTANPDPEEIVEERDGSYFTQSGRAISICGTDVKPSDFEAGLAALARKMHQLSNLRGKLNGWIVTDEDY